MKYYNKCPICGFVEETSTENTSFKCDDCKFYENDGGIK